MERDHNGSALTLPHARPEVNGDVSIILSKVAEIIPQL
jgi:hypothetical protein